MKTTKGENLSAAASAAAIIGSLHRNAEGALVMGQYHFEQRRVLPEYLAEAEEMCGRIARLQRSGKRRAAQALSRKMEALPRSVIAADIAPNLVTDVGAKLLLDTILAGSAFTASTFMGLKGTGVAVVADTQASHASWLEVGTTNAPQYTAPRKTVTWSAAAGTGAGARTKASSSTNTYAIITTGGTVDGAFLNINGTSAIDNTTGTLFSAGQFTGGAKTVAVSDTLTVTYSLAI